MVYSRRQGDDEARLNRQQRGGEPEKQPATLRYAPSGRPSIEQLAAEQASTSLLVHVGATQNGHAARIFVNPRRFNGFAFMDTQRATIFLHSPWKRSLPDCGWVRFFELGTRVEDKR